MLDYLILRQNIQTCKRSADICNSNRSEHT